MRSLRLRLTAVFAIITLPLMSLLCAFGILAMHQNTRTALNAATETAERAVESFGAEIRMLEEENTLLQEEWREQLKLLNKSESGGMELYWLWEAVQGLRKRCASASAGYIKVPGEKIIRMTSDRQALSAEDVWTLQEKLAEVDFSSFRHQRVHLLDSVGLPWLAWNVNYGSVSYGLLFSEETFLGNIEQIVPGFHVNLTEQSEALLPRDGILTGKAAVEVPFDDGSILLYGTLPYSRLILPGTIIIGLVIVMMFMIIPVEWKLLRREVLEPMGRLKNGMKELEESNMDYRLQTDAPSEDFIQLNTSFNSMADEITHLRVESYEKELEKLRVQAVNLSLQANPHLLLNSLSMIYSLSLSRNYTVMQEYIQQLMSYFRYSLRTNDELVTLKSELDFVNNFLNIQRIRFPNAFEGSVDYDSKLDQVLIPPLLIENFVENAIKHGRRAGTFLHINVSVTEESGEIKVLICDDGAGMDNETLAMLNEGLPKEDEFGIHLGVWNCRKRLELFFDGRSSLTLSNRKEGGTKVEIRFPVSFERGNEE